MKTLGQFNEERRLAYKNQRDAEKPHANGIQCEECGAELWDSDPTVTLMSNPPQKKVHCPGCKWTGYRFA